MVELRLLLLRLQSLIILAVEEVVQRSDACAEAVHLPRGVGVRWRISRARDDPAWAVAWSQDLLQFRDLSWVVDLYHSAHSTHLNVAISIHSRIPFAIAGMSEVAPCIR